MPALSDEERLTILRGSFSNLGRLLVEFSHFPGFNQSNIADLVTYEGFEHYQNAVRRGKASSLLRRIRSMGTQLLRPFPLRQSHEIYRPRNRQPEWKS